MTLGCGAFAATVAVATILAHAVLLRSGEWQGDEYVTFATFRTDGLHFLLERILHWSPRPISELALGLYYLLVSDLHRPLVDSVLATIWLATFGMIVLAGRRQLLIVSLSLSALFLAIDSPGEMFYWPMGAIAYMPTLGGIAAVVLTGLDWPPTDGGWRPPLCSVLLVLTAGTTEVGAMFTVLLGVALTVHFVLAAPKRIGESGFAVCWWWALPALLGLAVLVLVRLGRASHPGELVPNGSYADHPAGSVIAAVPVLLRGLVALEGSGIGSFPAAIAAKLLLLGGCASLVAVAGAPRPAVARLLALLAALLGTSLLTIATAYEQFGSLCCQRHATMRQCLALLAIAVLGTIGGNFAATRFRPQAWVAQTLLGLAIVAAMIARTPLLIADYGKTDTVVAARADTWKSGRARGTHVMVFFNPPHTVIANDFRLPPGLYRRASTNPWFVRGVMQFFHKDAMTVRGAPTQ